tara:strand:- start:55423 stop:55896 length:474 start_codon:yes stop_codon:yes gene_type:complete
MKYIKTFEKMYVDKNGILQPHGGIISASEHQWKYGSLEVEDDIDAESLCKKLLLNKQIIATDDILSPKSHFRIKSKNLKFTPKSLKLDGNILRIYVPEHSVVGSVTNPSQYTNQKALYLVITSWIAFQIINVNFNYNIDVLVSPLSYFVNSNRLSGF